MNMKEFISIYYHIPFCRARCKYCDFNTYAGMDHFIPAYMTALENETRLASSASADRYVVKTLFFGGGTPSVVPAVHYAQLFNTIRKTWDLIPNAEISLEANPGTVGYDYLVEMRRVGFNRISLGMQSANNQELSMLGRIHDHEDTIQAVRWARKAGFENLSLDLIYGLPGQRLSEWMENVEKALELEPDHLSMYALTVEDGTPLKTLLEHELLPQPDDDLAADMYEAASARVEQAGFGQYEISNWAQKGMECQHNLTYWRDEEYFGFGAGAAGYIDHSRVVNVLPIGSYIQKISAGNAMKNDTSPALDSEIHLDPADEMKEMLMVGLRLVREGVSAKKFEKRFGVRMEDRFREQITRLIKLGLLEWEGEGREILRLTPHAYLVGNQVFMEFV